MCLLIMETDVVVPDQYDQFCVSGVSEHPVEATHVVLPVLQGEQHSRRRFQACKKEKLPGDARER